MSCVSKLKCLGWPFVFVWTLIHKNVMDATHFDALLSSLLDPLEGLSMVNCG